jgi:signal transduction histidine kinase
MVIDQRVMWREGLLVAAGGLIQVGGPIVASHHQAGYGTPPIGGLALLAIGVAAIPLRLTRPVVALAIAFSSTLAYVSLDYAKGPIFVGLIVTFGNAVLKGYRRVAIGSLVAGFVGFSWLGPGLGRGDTATLGGVLGLGAWLLVLYTACELIRARRESAREAARAKADTLQRQIANERLAIARELHDVVAHNMSLINLQAGVALHITEGIPETTREALETIKSASKEALVELRSILGVLRHADEGDSAPRAPTPGLATIAELVGRAQAAGVDVTLHVDVDPSELPRPVDMAAFRIVQESLTNVARHASPPIATVVVHRADDTLVVSITDIGAGSRRADHLPSGGNGLPGMRERAASVGGTLVAGPRLGNGFSVEARLPIPDRISETVS